MAEIISAPEKGARRPMHKSIRVDLTPMVDLGFLLITFFIFTTTQSEPKAMQLALPADGGTSEIGESNALTIVPFDKDKVFYYHGSFEEAVANQQYGFTHAALAGGIGAVIRQKKQAMNLVKPGSDTALMLLIKPAETAAYENVVSMLDEAVINVVPRYALTDITPAEYDFLHTHEPQ